MQPALRLGKRQLPLSTRRICAVQSRHASLTGAISRGVREAQKSAEDRRGRYDGSDYDSLRRRKPLLKDNAHEDDGLPRQKPQVHDYKNPDRRRFASYHDSDPRKERPSIKENLGQSRWPGRHLNDNNLYNQMSTSEEPADQQRPRRLGNSYPTKKTVDYLIEAPRTVPYTAADSQFLYGLHSIEAALRANRRTFHKLYVYVAEDGGVRSDGEKQLYRLAARANIKVVRVGGPEWKQKLAQLAEGRAHNGFVLEASPIPTPIIKSIDQVEHAGASWKPEVDGLTAIQPLSANAENRFPLLLLLDGITDVGNIGAILRSVSFFGIDGVLVPEFNSTSSGLMLKASAGSSEYVPLFRVRHDFDFLRSCQANGWHVATSVAPGAAVRVVGARHPQTAASRPIPDRILESKPVILVLGNEGEGVRTRISKLSDSFVSIQSAPTVHLGLDSLNVSIAAALLMRDLVAPFLNSSNKSARNSDHTASRLKRKTDEDLF